MEMTNLYPNLPGNLVEFRDGGLSARTSDTDTTNPVSILIIGTAIDGPVKEPVAVDSDTITKIFGKSVDANGKSNKSTLVRFANQARALGYTDIRCMRMSGKEAELEIRKINQEETTEKTVSRTLGTINGNDAIVDHELAHGPIADNSLVLSITTANGSSEVGYQNLRNYSKKVNISANLVSAGAVITAKYNYKNIGTKKAEEVTVSITGGNFDKVKLSDKVYQTISGIIEDASNLGFDTYGYPFVDSAVSPVKVTVTESAGVANDTVLVSGTDYTWDATNQEITILSSIALASGDKLSVEYVPYVITNAEETIQMTGGLQKFALANKPTAGTEVVTIGTTTVTKGSGWNYSVSDEKEVSINPALFNIGDQIRISYKYGEVVQSADNLIIRSKSGGAQYNDCKVQIVEFVKDGVAGKKLILTKPDSKKLISTENPMEFSSFDYETIGELCQAINGHGLNNIFNAYTDSEDAEMDQFPLISSNLAGGEDGVKLTSNQKYEALSGKRNEEGYLIERGVYQMIENYRVDDIYVAGVYADEVQTVDPNSTFHDQLCLACAALTYRTKAVSGLIDMKPNPNTTLKGVQEYTEKLLQYNNLHYMKDSTGKLITDSEGNTMDIGWYTTAVAGPDPLVNGEYVSPALCYGATLSLLETQNSPMNKKLNNAKGFKYTFSNAQLNSITGNRIVTFRNNGTNGAFDGRVVDGITCGASTSDYARVSTRRVATRVADEIREVADPFIGNPNTTENRNALSALISKRLAKLFEDGVVSYYKFTIISTANMILIGELKIDTVIAAPMDLRKVTNVVSLTAGK